MTTAVMTGEAIGRRQIPIHEKRAAAKRLSKATGEGKSRLRETLLDAYGVSARTLRRWVQQYCAGVLGTKRMGRPRVEVPWALRFGVLAMLAAQGVRTAEASIRRAFPQVPLRRIREMKQKMKQAEAAKQRRGQGRLLWPRAGRIWAMDYTKPGKKLKGGPYLLIVVDVASGFRLASIPARSEGGALVRETLELLFSVHGRPLVIKSDNGSAFMAKATRQLLEERDIEMLRSPPRRPQYNGSCERSLGHLKLRIEQVAAHGGHAGHWTAEDVEQAREQANRTLAPRQLKGKTPQQAHDQRRPIGDRERRRFKVCIAREKLHVAKAAMNESGTITRVIDSATLVRRAIVRALIKCGYLKIWRGR